MTGASTGARPSTGVDSAGRHEATLRQLELLVNRRLDGLLHGDHRGLVPGEGSEAGESREYRPGDDVRRMDWNVTARTAVPHVRETVADRELETWLVVDASASLDFGTTVCEKRDLALAAAAAFGFLTARAGNRVGAVIGVPGDRPVTVPPRTGRDSAMAVLHRLADTPRAGTGEHTLEAALQAAARTARRRGLVVVVSDFLEVSGWPRAIRSLGSRHQVVAVELRDPREDELPAVGLVTFVDPETGRRLEVQTSQAALRGRFAEAAAAQRDRIRHDLRAAGAGHLVLSTERDWLLDVVRFVSAARRRR